MGETGREAASRQRGQDADAAISRRRGLPGVRSRSIGTSRFANLFRPGAAFALLIGAVAVQLLTKLPPIWVDLALGVGGLLLVAWRGPLMWCGFVLVGAAWTMLRADVALSHRLAAELEGRDLIVTGAVRGLPRVADEATRFAFAVQAEADSEPAPVRGILRLSWRDTAPPIEPCSIWRLHVRLRRPRGMIDPGAFDFERYALSEGITATGYVREDEGNRVEAKSLFCVDGLRARITA